MVVCTLKSPRVSRRPTQRSTTSLPSPSRASVARSTTTRRSSPRPSNRSPSARPARYDCGSKLGYLKANVEYALKHPELSEEFRDYLGDLTGDWPKKKAARSGKEKAEAERTLASVEEEWLALSEEHEAALEGLSG